MAEVVRLLHTVIGKVDGLASSLTKVEADVGVLKTDVKELKTNMTRVEGKVDLLSGQFHDVAVQAIEDTQRITTLEGRVDTLEGKSH